MSSTPKPRSTHNEPVSTVPSERPVIGSQDGPCLVAGIEPHASASDIDLEARAPWFKKPLTIQVGDRFVKADFNQMQISVGMVFSDGTHMVDVNLDAAKVTTYNGWDHDASKPMLCTGIAASDSESLKRAAYLNASLMMIPERTLGDDYQGDDGEGENWTRKAMRESFLMLASREMAYPERWPKIMHGVVSALGYDVEAVATPVTQFTSRDPKVLGAAVSRMLDRVDDSTGAMRDAKVRLKDLAEETVREVVDELRRRDEYIDGIRIQMKGGSPEVLLLRKGAWEPVQALKQNLHPVANPVALHAVIDALFQDLDRKDPNIPAYTYARQKRF